MINYMAQALHGRTANPGTSRHAISSWTVVSTHPNGDLLILFPFTRKVIYQTLITTGALP